MKSQHKDVKGKDSFVGKQKTGWSRDKREKNKVILGKKMEGTNPGRKDLVPTLTKWFSTFISINNRRKRGGHPSQPTHGNPKTYAPFSALRRHNSQPIHVKISASTTPPYMTSWDMLLHFCLHLSIHSFASIRGFTCMRFAFISYGQARGWWFCSLSLVSFVYLLHKKCQSI